MAKAVVLGVDSKLLDTNHLHFEAAHAAAVEVYENRAEVLQSALSE